MKMSDVRKNFDFAQFNTVNPENFQGINKENLSVVVRGADLARPEFKEIMDQLEKDTRKGVSVYFNEGEEIYFLPFEKQVYEISGFEIYNGKIRVRLAVSAYCERYGYFFFPMSIVRRVPLDEQVTVDGDEYPSGLNFLLQDNPLGSKLILATLSDLDRAKMVSDKIVTVSKKVRLLQPVFTKQGDTMVRTDQTRPLTCYKLK